MGDVDVNAMIFTNVVAKRNRNVSVKNVIVKQNRNAIVFMKRKGINMNCTPIVRHSLTIGGAVFLWLNLQLMKK
ncbi:hypothetical protein, partial [Bacillus thuringiensis]|uniref:hypothetical protein n=1 Tax=Bacillus thuringiensis TaxID=1428 RepID=UPI001A8E5995